MSQETTLDESRDDNLMWKSLNGPLVDFSVQNVFEDIRTRSAKVGWADLVWASHGIPKHSTLLWLVFKERLKTQDRLRAWDVQPTVDISTLKCLLCGSVQDSHNHLFFDCLFSSQVWTKLLTFAEIPMIGPSWANIVDWLLPLAKHKTAEAIVGRLIFGAAVYFLWQERNNRLFGRPKRSTDVLVQVITHTVRLKLLSIVFKSNTRVDKMKAVWKLNSEDRPRTS